MTSFRILSKASEELEACVSYYNSQRSNLGTEFLAKFERIAERILKLPNAARMICDDFRSKPIHRFPFYVLYRSQKTTLRSLPSRIVVDGPGTGLIAHSQLPNR
jgi:hypothetical protein